MSDEAAAAKAKHAAVSRSTKTINTYYTDGDVKNIILHIIQDSADKEHEIDVKLDEEFKLEKSRVVVKAIERIDREYKQKKYKTKMSTLVFQSKLKNSSRIRILQNKFMHVEDAKSMARQRLTNKDMSAHSPAYKGVLLALVMQGLCKLLEPKVYVICRKEDSAALESVIREASGRFQEATGLACAVLLKDGDFLDKSSEGGVVLTNADGTVSVDNTLWARLGLLAAAILPEINFILFGQSIRGLGGPATVGLHDGLYAGAGARTEAATQLSDMGIRYSAGGGFTRTSRFHHEKEPLDKTVERLSIGRKLIVENRYISDADMAGVFKLQLPHKSQNGKEDHKKDDKRDSHEK